MAKVCKVAVNGQTFKAKAGDILLDAALRAGVEIPHDCKSGVCGSCASRLVSGSTILGETAAEGVIHACQARILSDLAVEVEDVPAISCGNGVVSELRPLAPDVFEVTIETENRAVYRPGQYFKFKFEGFAGRSYSATRPLVGRARGRSIVLQVRRYENGRVSSQFGRRIRVGHPVLVQGPYGSAFLREEKIGPLTLVSSGTGFAPIWSIASAALRDDPERDIRLIAGVRTEDAIYMAPALERLARFKNVDVIVTIGRRPSASQAVRAGYPNEHLPALCKDDTVYACGASQMIDAVAKMVKGTGAKLFCDPFEPAPEGEDDLFAMGMNQIKKLISWPGEFGLAGGKAFPSPAALAKPAS